MNELEKVYSKHPVLLGLIIFFLISLLLNLITFPFLRGYINDMFHVYTVIVPYEIFIIKIGNYGAYLISIIILMAIVVDSIVGMIISSIINKFTHSFKMYKIWMGIFIFVHFFIICFQFLLLV